MARSLLLASSSPRRHALLKEAGYEFESVSPAAAERCDSVLTVREVTAWNATRKALAVARVHPQRVVLGADTLVSLRDRIIGKPADLREAAAILRQLAGRTHEVCSAVFVCHLASGRSVIFHEVSQVRFRPLSDEAIRRYFTKVDPLDKAGAYAAQGVGREIIERITGSFSNVVGLPMEKTVCVLAEFGVAPKVP